MKADCHLKVAVTFFRKLIKMQNFQFFLLKYFHFVDKYGKKALPKSGYGNLQEKDF